MKIIYMVRDPLERQFSAWRMYYYFAISGILPDEQRTRWALKGFDSYMRELKAIGRWITCCYYYQLEAYREFFPNEQICISFLEDWQPDKRSEIARIMRFIGLDPGKWIEQKQVNENTANMRTTDRPLIKALRSYAIGSKVIGLIPEKLKQLVRPVIGKVPVDYPHAMTVLSEQTKQDFRDFVREDALKFLRANGKPDNFWASICPDDTD